MMFILGAGMTGLAAGLATRLPVFESAQSPGGICSSYRREGYRFERGGGHWIFGAGDEVLSFMGRFVSLKKYERRSSVFFPEASLYVPYPLQNYLFCLDSETAAKARAEMSLSGGEAATLREWLTDRFGSTLCKLFFHPFHSLYTAGLDAVVVPQDSYKSPVDPNAAGYNTEFYYPEEGLDALARGMAGHCDIRYGKRVVQIDVNAKRVYFADGSRESYERLISTIPLNHLVRMCGMRLNDPEYPYTSVLVLNIGAKRGPRCPADHWLYVPQSRSGFYRVGFYSHVDPSFAPGPERADGRRVAIYVERAYANGLRPSDEEVSRYELSVVEELQEWGFIGEAEIVDPTWIDVAYTWAYPASRWREAALQTLAACSIDSIGRYGAWRFQGIAESIREGLSIGAKVLGKVETLI